MKTLLVLDIDGVLFPNGISSWESGKAFFDGVMRERKPEERVSFCDYRSEDANYPFHPYIAPEKENYIENPLGFRIDSKLSQGKKVDRYSSELFERLKKVVDNNDVQVVWNSSWGEEAIKVHEKIGFACDFMNIYGGYKLRSENISRYVYRESLLRDMRRVFDNVIWVEDSSPLRSVPQIPHNATKFVRVKPIGDIGISKFEMSEIEDIIQEEPLVRD